MNYNNAEFEAAYGLSGQLPPSDLPEICFSGRSNVGKSSLINKLLGRKSLARVSTKPGKTVTVNFYKLDGVRLADLPGYGYAKVARAEKERWARLMEHYFNSDRNIKLVVQLVDMRHDATDDDMMMLRFLQDSGFKFIVPLTKSDKLNKSEREARLTAFKSQFAEFDDITYFPFSSSNGEGVTELKECIEGIISCE